MVSHLSGLHYSSTKYIYYIITTKFKLLSHFLILLLTGIAIKQLKYDTTLNMIPL